MIVSVTVRPSLIAAVLATLISLVPRSANAEPQIGDWGNFNADLTVPAVIFGSVLFVDVGFGVYDLSMMHKSHPTKRGFAIAEVAFSAPQIALGTAGLVAALSNKNGAGVLFIGGLTLLPVALTAHGIHTLISRNDASDTVGPQHGESNPPPCAGLDSLRVQPNLVAGRTSTGPGMSLQFNF